MYTICIFVILIILLIWLFYKVSQKGKFSRPTLTDLAIKYCLDKSIHSGSQDYIPEYITLFEPRRDDVKQMLEIGIGSLENNQMGGLNGDLVELCGYKTGNSLKCWAEYFPNATIHGIDIYKHSELDTDRIKTYVADQSNANDLKRVAKAIGDKLDIIIDDGSHIHQHQVISFMNLHQHLTPDGIYVIEDINPKTAKDWVTASAFPPHFRTDVKNNFNIQFLKHRQKEPKHVRNSRIVFTRSI